MKITSAIQTCVLVLQIKEHLKKLPQIVSKGVPNMYRKSLKIHPGTFQGPSVCTRDPFDCKTVPKWCPRTFKRTPNRYLGTLTGAKHSTKSNNQLYNKQNYIFDFLIDFHPGNQFFYSCQSFQSASEQTTGYQRGRGEALRYNYVWENQVRMTQG